MTRQNGAVLVGFRAAFVFDISQTEGKELPEHARVSGDAGANRDRLIDFINALGIELEFNEYIAPAMGMSYGGKIVLLPGQSKAEEFSCLVHELGHELVHKSERRKATTRTVRETEPKPLPLWSAKPWDWRRHRRITSSCITATRRYWLKVLKSSRKHPPSFLQHWSQSRNSRIRCRKMIWQPPVNSHQPYGGRLAVGGENLECLSSLCQYRSYPWNESLDVTSQKEKWLSGQWQAMQVTRLNVR